LQKEGYGSIQTMARWLLDHNHRKFSQQFQEQLFCFVVLRVLKKDVHALFQCESMPVLNTANQTQGNGVFPKYKQYISDWRAYSKELFKNPDLHPIFQTILKQFLEPYEDSVQKTFEDDRVQVIWKVLLDEDRDLVEDLKKFNL